MVIALSGVHAIRSEIKCMITKSHDHEAGVRFAIKHKSVWFQTKITRHEVQFPLYYIRFEILILNNFVKRKQFFVYERHLPDTPLNSVA